MGSRHMHLVPLRHVGSSRTRESEWCTLHGKVDSESLDHIPTVLEMSDYSSFLSLLNLIAIGPSREGLYPLAIVLSCPSGDQDLPSN